jgi:hypothetical protein
VVLVLVLVALVLVLVLVLGRARERRRRSNAVPRGSLATTLQPNLLSSGVRRCGEG